MEDIDRSVMLKEKLLTAGIDEMVVHGIKGFSLRRVAAACGASCAAPYKHFKNKEDFIEEIIAYVNEKWDRLSSQIINAFDDPKERIAQLCIANVRFKISNPLYGMGKKTFDEKISSQVEAYFATDCDEKLFLVSTIVTGAATLMSEGKMDNTDSNFQLLRENILNELE